ncbi:MAG TPA: fructosamine kinase family protein [Arachnia sp.]|nr:fructosamine kinase family protein [Arachnia sp.]HMT85319.1 fructosamine kinase family protein [Arachnia sp.]
MNRTFTKAGTNPRGEASGLAWLAEAERDGGARVAKVIGVSDRRLEIEFIVEAPPSPEGARAFGRALAHTHAAGAGWWGCPPGGWAGPAHVGNSRTPLVLDPQDAPASWGEFYVEHRIEAFARRLRDRSVIDGAQAAVFDRLASRLQDGDLDHPQPQLVQAAGHPVARVHGDMWAGNVLYDGSPTGAALIDPMAHGGHAETDLATLSVFGFPYLEWVYEGYDEESPLAPGWRDRIPLHQLGIVIMHADLFGGGYVRSALSLARR